MSFDARHPEAAVRASADASPFPAALAAMKVSPDALAKIGEAFAGALSSAQASLSSMDRLLPKEQSKLDSALKAIERLERFGLQLQALARILAGNAPLPRERIDLAHAAREAIEQWGEEARRSGASFGALPRSCELESNAAAIAQLLDLGLEYALHLGRRIDIGVGVEGLSSHPVLTIRAQRSVVNDAADDIGFAELHWLLFADLARAVGLVPQRTSDVRTTTLALAFPAPDLEAATGHVASAALPHTSTATGRRVLLIEPRETSRWLASRLMGAIGMRVTTAANVDQARAGLDGEGAPDVVVTGLAIEDARFHALLDDLRLAQPRLRVVELVDDESAFDFSVPGSDLPARVGRHDMSRTLARAVSQELDTAWSAAALA
jgi:CheY-like chemotaxis protein